MDEMDGMKDGEKLVQVCRQSASSFLALEAVQGILIASEADSARMTSNITLPYRENQLRPFDPG